MTPDERRRDERRKFGHTQEEAQRCLYAPMHERRVADRRAAAFPTDADVRRMQAKPGEEFWQMPENPTGDGVVLESNGCPEFNGYLEWVVSIAGDVIGDGTTPAEAVDEARTYIEREYPVAS